MALAIEAVGDVLLETRATDGDVILNAGAGVSSSTGAVHIQSTDDVSIQANITADDSVRVIALNGTNDLGFNGIDLAASVSATSGDVQFQTQGDIRVTANQNTGVGLALFANGDVLQNANLSAVGSILVNAGDDYLMQAATSATAGPALFAIAGGQIDLGLVQALQVALRAGNNITDINGLANNVRANTLSMVSTAGGIGSSDLPNVATANANAIDIQLGRMTGTEDGRLAASAVSGIYLQDTSLAGLIIVDTIAALTVTATAQSVNFNSTRTAQDLSNAQLEIEDLRTTGGPIKVVMDNGSLTVRAGDANATAIDTGGNDLLLEARSLTRDLNIANGAIINTGAGLVTLKSG